MYVHSESEIALPVFSFTPSTCATEVATSDGSLMDAEFDQPYAVAIGIDHCGRRLQREPGLSNTAEANDRQQPFTR